MSTALDTEIRANYTFFQGVVRELMTDHEGEYVLLRGREIVGLFDNVGDAVRSGHAQFGDQPFSVQKVMDRPIDLGFIAYAADQGVSA